MESDSSLENEETQPNRRDWSKVPPAHNSDVSDDENFSRGAKSIESPPESPWGGANLDSPPASPAQGPESVSGSVSGRSPERPQTPDSGPESPQNSSRNSSPNGRSRKSSSSERSRSPSSDNGRPASPQCPQSPVSDKPPDEPRSPSPEKDCPQSPSTPNRSPRNYKESSDSEASPARNSCQSDSDDHSDSEDYRRRRKSKRSSSPSSNASPHQAREKPQQEKDLDLSDVSDCESLGAVSDEEKPKEKIQKEKEDGEKGDLTMIDDSEQLDFEAEETENKTENGEIVEAAKRTPQHPDKSEEPKEPEELEEGELSDEGDARPEETEPRPVCRFFSRGQCTWGSSCSYRHVGDGGGAPSPPKPTNSTPPSVKTSTPLSGMQLTPLSHHGAPMHPPRFVPRPHGPPFFRRPLRPMFPRFVHPGVTDKGNYTMFEMVRPLVPMNSGGPMLHPGPHGPPHLPHHHMYPPHIDPYMRPHIERPPPPMVRQIPPPYQQHQPPVARKETDQSSESAWERGLRQAKELIRKSSKRKETDADFEEKKMTLGVSSTAEGVDKENEFFAQPPHPAAPPPTSPYQEDHFRYNKIDDRRLSRDGYRERAYEYAGGGGGGWPYEGEESPLHHRGHRYPPPQRHHHQSREHPRGVEFDYYDERDERDRERRREGKQPPVRKTRPYRDRQSPRDSVHPDKQPQPYDISPSEIADKRRYERSRGKASKRGGDDEWADPWMRSKSPARKSRPVRKPSYSSKSSFSSSSSSRSSSYSSYSRSESRSSVSGSSRSRSRSASQRRNKKKKAQTRRNKSPFSRGSDKRSSDVERSLHMNPPAPSPTAPDIHSRLSPQRRERKSLNARLMAAMRKKKRSPSKSSSSGSDSSNSSDDSSSSLSDSRSSSTSRSPSPAPLPSNKSSRKKIGVDEKMAQTMKVKAMDALKLSGQKQQIKLNLKGKDSLSDRLLPPQISSSRKRPAESLPFDEGSPPNVKMSKKCGPSRREELLKQLKAVEDAIARKKSKI